MGEGPQVDPRDLPGYVRLPKRRAIRSDRQIRRSSASIPANLAEGCGRRSDGEMARFIQISMGSGSELSYHLLLARDLDLLKNTEYSRLNSDLEELMRMLSSLSQKIRNALAALRFKPRARS